MYCSGLMVAPLSKYLTNKIPSLSMKMLAITLATEVCTLNFVCVCVCVWWWLVVPFHCLSFSQWVVGLNLGFLTSNYSWQRSISILLIALENSAQMLFRAIWCLRWAFLAPTLCKLSCTQVFWWWPCAIFPVSVVARSSCIVMPWSSQSAHQPSCWFASLLPWLVSWCRPCHHCPFHCSWNNGPSVWLS
jgi:hypothetical protein